MEKKILKIIITLVFMSIMVAMVTTIMMLENVSARAKISAVLLWIFMLSVSSFYIYDLNGIGE